MTAKQLSGRRRLRSSGCAGVMATLALADASSRIVNVTAATLTVTQAAHDGKVITLNRAGGNFPTSSVI